MARIDLRYTTIRLQDGRTATGAVTGSPTEGSCDFDIATNTGAELKIGDRFTTDASGEENAVLTIATVSFADPTYTITFTSDQATNYTPVAADELTVLPNFTDVVVGDGNLTWSVTREFEYQLDRGNLDAVREGDQQPVDVSIDAAYDFVTSSGAEVVTPFEAFNQEGAAADWVSSDTDEACSPYSVDVIVIDERSCGNNTEKETTTLSIFRYESLEADLDAATISTSGRCNILKPTITRG